MGVGLEWFFAWVDPTDATFLSEYARKDEVILDANFEHLENEFARLDLTIKNPLDESGNAIPLLGQSRKVWAWFSYSFNEGEPVPVGFFRLVGLPSDLLNAKITLEFLAQPSDSAAQKAALANSLRFLPYYSETLIDARQREDHDAVLSGYPLRWYIDPITHIWSTSHLLIGDGVEELQHNELLFRATKLDFNQVGQIRVDFDVTFSWTQFAQGSLDIGSYIVTNWPNEWGTPNTTDIITSFTLTQDDWPKPLASLGDGWHAENSHCISLYDLSVKSNSRSQKIINKFADGRTSVTEFSRSTQYIGPESPFPLHHTPFMPPGSIYLQRITLRSSVNSTSTPLPTGGTLITSYSYSSSWQDGIVPLHHLRPALIAAYDAKRSRKERVQFSLYADVQSNLTNPAGDDIHKIVLNSVNLSEPIDDGIDAYIPIDDARRRSYITTERGHKDLEYLLALGRAQLMLRSRAARLTVSPVISSFYRFPDITLRKNVIVNDFRIAGGQAVGKVIGIAFSLSGGRFEWTVQIACCIGRGGEVEDVAGTPLYVDAAAMGPDLQEFEGRRIVFDSDVGYEPPLYDPNDDGIDFMFGPTVESVIEQGVTFENPPAAQRVALETSTFITGFYRGETIARLRTETLNKTLQSVPMIARFKLQSMTASFENNRDLVVTDLKLPTMINLEGLS